VLNVHVLHGTYAGGLPYGCTYIRLLRPLTHPSLAGELRLTHGEALPAGTPDAVLLERTWREGTSLADVESLLATLASRRIPLLYTLDDNLLDLFADEPWRRPSPEERHGIVSLLAREARGVIVSTDALRERLLRLARRVEVVPNALDERLFGPGPPQARRPGGPLVVGYMGTLTHDGDLQLVLRGLREALARSRAALEVVGVSAHPGFHRLFDGLPTTFRSPGDAHEYPRFVAFMRRSLRWDVAIAPLQDTPFHRGKSDLKLLDYGILGIPGVFSDVRPYRETLAGGAMGLLARNEPDAFRDALLQLLEDAELRRSTAGKALAYVTERRLLCQNAPRHLEAIRSLLGQAP
jgi:glycosyltransferase involved in cell wall biosynthesis